MITREYSLGKFQLSFSGLVFAFVVILMTYALVRIWKQVMAKKILKKAVFPPEPGNRSLP